MSTSTKSAYHHGDLRASLLEVAMRMLEAGDAFSLRALAREAGVSPTAPYRHFSDRDALESALATQGLRDLKAALTDGHAPPTSPSDLAEFAVGYVEFALRRPALFRLMFANACDEGNEERTQAAAEVRELLEAAMAVVFPGVDAAALGSAGWAFAHGMACLYLDGKLVTDSTVDPNRPDGAGSSEVEFTDEIAAGVRTAFAALLAATAQ